jgi:hypothetical protein
MIEGVSAGKDKFPSLGRLRAGLAIVLEQSGVPFDRLEVLGRHVNVAASTYPSEIVTCRINDHAVLKLFCKYSTHLNYDTYGHRGGVEYEARVYRDVLHQAKVSVPKYYGSYKESDTGRTWLVLDYLANTTRVSRVSDPDALFKAARWLGVFHAQNEASLVRGYIPFMNVYDADYYQGWADRAVLFVNGPGQGQSWMIALCDQFRMQIPALLAGPHTVVHGEFYPANVLVHLGGLSPVDWESAAIAAGEVDLACLTDRWPEQTARRCEREYARKRWPAGAVAEFDYRLRLARIYVQLRWLGDWFEMTAKDCRWRLERLHELGRRFGLVV